MRISDGSSDVCSSDLLVMMKTGWPFRQAAEKIREVLPTADEHRPKPTLSEERRLQALRDTWKASKLITAQADAGRYLASRGLMGPFSEAIRFVPKLKVTRQEERRVGKEGGRTCRLRW